jgi:hypothetical protein
MWEQSIELFDCAGNRFGRARTQSHGNGRASYRCLRGENRSTGDWRGSLLSGVVNFWNYDVPAEAQPKQVGHS